MPRERPSVPPVGESPSRVVLVQHHKRPSEVATFLRHFDVIDRHEVTNCLMSIGLRSYGRWSPETRTQLDSLLDAAGRVPVCVAAQDESHRYHHTVSGSYQREPLRPASARDAERARRRSPQRHPNDERKYDNRNAPAPAVHTAAPSRHHGDKAPLKGAAGEHRSEERPAPSTLPRDPRKEEAVAAERRRRREDRREDRPLHPDGAGMVPDRPIVSRSPSGPHGNTSGRGSGGAASSGRQSPLSYASRHLRHAPAATAQSPRPRAQRRDPSASTRPVHVPQPARPPEVDMRSDIRSRRGEARRQFGDFDGPEFIFVGPDVRPAKQPPQVRDRHPRNGSCDDGGVAWDIPTKKDGTLRRRGVVKEAAVDTTKPVSSTDRQRPHTRPSDRGASDFFGEGFAEDAAEMYTDVRVGLGERVWPRRGPLAAHLAGGSPSSRPVSRTAESIVDDGTATRESTMRPSTESSHSHTLHSTLDRSSPTVHASMGIAETETMREPTPTPTLQQRSPTPTPPRAPSSKEESPLPRTDQTEGVGPVPEGTHPPLPGEKDLLPAPAEPRTFRAVGVLCQPAHVCAATGTEAVVVAHRSTSAAMPLIVDVAMVTDVRPQADAAAMTDPVEADRSSRRAAADPPPPPPHGDCIETATQVLVQDFTASTATATDAVAPTADVAVGTLPPQPTRDGASGPDATIAVADGWAEAKVVTADRGADAEPIVAPPQPVLVEAAVGTDAVPTAATVVFVTAETMTNEASHTDQTTATDPTALRHAGTSTQVVLQIASATGTPAVVLRDACEGVHMDDDAAEGLRQFYAQALEQSVDHAVAMTNDGWVGRLEQAERERAERRVAGGTQTTPPPSPPVVAAAAVQTDKPVPAVKVERFHYVADFTPEDSAHSVPAKPITTFRSLTDTADPREVDVAGPGWVQSRQDLAAVQRLLAGRPLPPSDARAFGAFPRLLAECLQDVAARVDGRRMSQVELRPMLPDTLAAFVLEPHFDRFYRAVLLLYHVS